MGELPDALGECAWAAYWLWLRTMPGRDSAAAEAGGEIELGGADVWRVCVQVQLHAHARRADGAVQVGGVQVWRGKLNGEQSSAHLGRDGHARAGVDVHARYRAQHRGRSWLRLHSGYVSQARASANSRSRGETRGRRVGVWGSTSASGCRV
jgi:hypothetical protein